MNRYCYGLLAVLVIQAILWGQPVKVTRVTHRDMQAVTETGTSAFTPQMIGKVSLEGILLNAPEQWLNPTPDPTIAPWFMGGQWQIAIQGEGNDHAGTFCWMGQNYGNGPGDYNYTNVQWLSELQRLNHDPNTGYVFRPGDRVRVTGYYLFYEGVVNINENHSIDPALDFTLELMKPAVGLPQPESVTLADLKDAQDQPIFDPNRLVGPEYYQGCLTRIEDVNIINPENWGQGRTITVADATGRTFPVYLARGAGIAQHTCPAGQIDVIGIMDQAGLTDGYHLLVMDYDGNGLVLGQMTTQRGNLPEDINGDHQVTIEDVNLVQAAVGQTCAGLVE